MEPLPLSARIFEPLATENPLEQSFRLHVPKDKWRGTPAGLTVGSTTFATDLAASKWTRQTIPQEMAQAVLRRMMELKAGDIDVMPAKGKAQQMDAFMLLETLYLRYHHQGLPPWFLHNGGC